MKFKSLFSIMIKHWYYNSTSSGEKCDDLKLVPTPECWKKISKYRLRLRRTKAKWQLITPVDPDDETQPFISLAEGESFKFFLKLKNPEFLNFSAIDEETLTKLYAQVAFPLFSNDSLGANDIELPMSEYLPERTDQMKVVEAKKEESFFLKGIPVPGLTSGNFELTGITPAPPISEYKESLKRVQIDMRNQSKGKQFWLTYRAYPEWPADIFGIVEILNNDSLIMGKTFEIYFKEEAVKSVIWHYYTVIGGPDQLSISDGPSDFSVDTGAPDDIVNKLTAKFPNAYVTHFYSDDPIRYQETVIPGIKLKSNHKVLIQNLPNPTPGNQGVAIINIL